MQANLGETHVMLTTNPDNTGSIKTIEHNGGKLEAEVPDGETGDAILQYWIRPGR